MASVSAYRFPLLPYGRFVRQRLRPAAPHMRHFDVSGIAET
jgi:hypothetical protein